jgi:hypothetical protein
LGIDRSNSREVTSSGGRILRARLMAGRLFTPEDDRAAIVHECLLYQLGLTSDGDENAVVGRPIRFKYHAGGPENLDLAAIVARRMLHLGEKETRSLQSALKRMATFVRSLPLSGDERDLLVKFFEAAATPSASPSPKASRTCSAEFTIVGVIRERAETDEQPGPLWNWDPQAAEILLPISGAQALAGLDPKHV